jgi:hypothetical protein
MAMGGLRVLSYVKMRKLERVDLNQSQAKRFQEKAEGRIDERLSSFGNLGLV